MSSFSKTAGFRKYFPSTGKTQSRLFLIPPVSKAFSFHFHDGLLRTVDLHEETQLRLKISPSYCGEDFGNCSHTVIQVVNYHGYCTSDKNFSGAVSQDLNWKQI